MSTLQKLQKLLLIVAIGLGLLSGTPMRPDQMEDLLHRLDQPKIAQARREEADRMADPSD